MIETIVISDWREILDHEVQWSSAVFRGQCDATWELSSSLQRCLKGTSYEETPTNTEFWFLREFKRRAHHYLKDVPQDQHDFIAWLSLMQHYGTPTRLIDFTYSFYIACYFALSGSRGDSAVWAIEPRWLLDIGGSAFDIDNLGVLRDEMDDSIYSATNRYLGRFLSTASGTPEAKVLAGAVPVEPLQHHQRLGTQQGLFIVPLDIETSLLGNLAQHSKVESSEPIKKFILKSDFREDGLAHLRRMNITAETLYPGIDGFAKSIAHRVLCM